MTRVDQPSESIARSIPEALERQALCFFFSEFVLVPKHIEACRGYLEFLLPLYTKAGPSSPLFSITSAVSLRAFAHRLKRPEVDHNSRQAHIQAVTQIKQAITDPIASNDDGTLLSVMFLGLYENMTATRESLPTWGKHAEGAAALVKHRGNQMLKSNVSKRLYWSVLAQLVINQISKCQAIEPALSIDRVSTLHRDLLTMGNAANRLTLLGLRIPRLRELGAKCLNAPMSSAVAKDVFDLLREAKDVDREISGWPLGLPMSWKYKTVRFSTRGSNAVETLDCYPGPVDIYYDLYVANTWNTYRGYRIHCLMIIINCIERLVPPSRHGDCEDYSVTITILRGLVNRICASVPFHLGLEVPFLSTAESICLTSIEEFYHDEASLPRFRSEEGSHLRTSKTIGGFFLIWTLFVAYSVTCIPEMQRSWILARFRSISTRYGITQADVLAALGLESFEKGRSQSITDYAPPPYVPFDTSTIELEDIFDPTESWNLVN